MTDRLAATAIRVLAPRASISSNPLGDALGNIITTPLPDGAAAYVTAALAAYRLVKPPAATQFAIDGVHVVATPTGGSVWVRETELSAGVRCVRSLADLPAPVGTDITLEANTTYCFLGTVDIGDIRLIAQDNTQLIGRDFTLDGVTSAHPTATVFSMTGASLNVEALTVTNTSAAGAAIEYDDAATGAAFYRRVALIGAVGLRQGDAVSLTLTESIIIPAVTGVLLEGTVQTFALLQSRIDVAGAAAVGIDVDAAAAVTFFVVLDVAVITTAAGQTGVRATGTVTRGFIQTSLFDGPGTFVSGFTKGTPTWRFLSNVGLLDSVALGEAAFFASSANTVTIAVASTPTAIPGAPTAFTTSAASERFVQDPAGSGILKYVGLDDIQVRVIATVSVEKATSATTEVGVGLTVAVNGTAVPTSQRTANVRTVPGRASQQITSEATVTLSENDTIQALLQNNTNTDNIDVYSAGIGALGQL